MIFETKKITIDQLTFNVFDQGSGDVIMLLHGYPDSIKVWRNVIPNLLDEGYRVIAFDQRGFGETDAPTEVTDYRIEKLVTDVVALIKVLGITKKIRLVGHDWGAQVGWAVSMAFPELIASYVAISVGHPLSYLNDGGFEQQKKGWYMMFHLHQGFAERVITDNNWAFFRNFSQNNPEINETWLPDLSRPGRLTAGLNWYRANLDPTYASKDEIPDFPPVSVPVLGLFGLEDPYLSKEQMVYSKKYMEANFSYLEIPNAGHWLPLERPDDIVQAILTFRP